MGGCHKSPPRAQGAKAQVIAQPVSPSQAPAEAQAQQLSPLQGKLGPADIERLCLALEQVQEERARVKALSAHLREAYLTVSQLAELLEQFDLEVARLEAIERVHGRLIEGEEGEERHVLLELFEDPSHRARAVDLLGWH